MDLLGCLFPDNTSKTLVEAQDGPRLRTQYQRVRELMQTHEWYSLAEISALLDYPEASVSARLRQIRQADKGLYVVERRRRTVGQWEYRMVPLDKVE